MELDKAIRERRSVRKFKNRPVEREKITEIIDAARWAPSACNRQLWEYIVIDNDKVKTRLVREAGSMPLVRNAPLVIGVLYDNKYNLKQHANLQSAAASIQNMLLKAYEVGLGSVWLAGVGSQDVIKKILNIPENLDVVALVAIGYPDESPAPPSRRPVKEIIHFNRFGKESKYPNTPYRRDWNLSDVREFQKYTIRAVGPEPDILLPPLKKEFETEIKLVKRFVDLNEKTLFLFPNSGTYMLNAIGNHSADVYEMSEEVVKYVLERKKRMNLRGKINVLIGDGKNIPAGDSKYTNVVCLHPFEYLPGTEIIGEVYRILKDNGSFVVSFRNKFSFYGINEFIKRKIRKSTEISNLGPRETINCFEMRGIIKQNKFKIKKEVGIGAFPKPEKLQDLTFRNILGDLCGVKVLVCRKYL